MKENYVLVKWSDNWADEMDLDGFCIYTESAWKDFRTKLSAYKDRFTICVGTNLFGVCFINPHDLFGSELTGMSRWIYNEILGTIVAYLFAALWGMKTASDIHYSQEIKK